MVQTLPTSNPRFSSAWDNDVQSTEAQQMGATSQFCRGVKIRNMMDGATADEASRAKSKEENDPLELMCIHDRYAC